MKMLLRLTLLFLLMIIPSDSIIAEDVNTQESLLSIELDRNSFAVGEIIALKLKFNFPEGSTFSPESKIKGLEDFTIISQNIQKGLIELNLIVDRREPFEIGPLSLSYINKDGNTKTIISDSILINIISNLGDKPNEAQLKPIMEIIPTTALWIKYIPWIAGGIILIIIIVAVFWWIKRKKKQSEEILRLQPSHVIAMVNIESLNREGLFEKGRYKEFYFRLSEILRQYLETLRGFPAAEFTTEEIARCISNEEDRKLLSLLRNADLVKFADTIPTPARKDEDITMAIGYIRNTTPIPSIIPNTDTQQEGEK